MALPTFYSEGTQANGVGDVTYDWPAHAADWVGILMVQTAAESVATPSGWTLIGTCQTGTGGSSGSVGIWVFWRRATSGSEASVTITDPGDHQVGRIITIRDAVNSGNPINLTNTDTKSTAQTGASIVVGTTTVNNCYVLGIFAGAIDSATFQGSTNITDGSLTSVGFEGWVNTTDGVGGGFYLGSGAKITAGSCGTLDADNWASSTKQANLVFAISDTATASSVPTLSSRPPVYPPPTRRIPTLALTVAAAIVPFVATITDLESELSWQPRYADQVPAKPRALNTGGSFAPAPDPIPDPPAPDFSWLPRYPDVLRAARRNPMGGMYGDGASSKAEPVIPLTAYYGTSATGGATAGTTDRTCAITPAAGDLIVAFASLSVNTNTAMTATDDQGGTYYLAGTALWGTSANIGACFVRNSLCSSASAHTITVASGSNTAGAIIAVTAKGMARAGRFAVRSFGSQADQASGTAAPALNRSALFENMTLVAVASGDTTTTAPTGWTERQDTSQATPTTALEVATRDFGFEGTTITFGATTSTTFASFALELDGSAWTEVPWLPTYPDFARRAPPRPHGGMVQPPYDTSSPVATDIGWLPSFPDFAYGARRNPHGGSVLTFDFAGEVFGIGGAACEQKIFAVSPETGSWTTHSTNISITTVANATDLFTANSHGMKTGDGPYRFSTTGTLPAGLSSTTDYYVDVESANTFKVSTTAANAIAGTNVAISDDGSGTLTLVRVVNTAPLGSAIIAFGARGYWNLDSSAPTDNKSNTFTAAAGSPHAYSTYPDSDAWVGYKFNAAGGAAHTVSLTYQNFDEPTVGLLEIYGVNRLQDSSHVERIGAATITSSPVTATARAILVAFVFGSGPVGQDHTWTFLDGFTKIPAASDEGDISANGYIQVAEAYKVVNAGTYTFSVQGISNEGAQLFLLAFQATDAAPAQIDWYRQPLDPVRRIRTTRESHIAEPITTTADVATNWQPEYPDRIYATPRQVLGGEFAPPRDTSNVPYLSWSPSYPDFARKAPPRLPGIYTAPAWEAVGLVDLSLWRPAYPDFAPGPRRPVNEGGAVAPPRDTSNVPYLSWQPSYPDRIPRRHQAERVELYQCLLDFRAPELSWQPSYPDFARAPLPRPRGGLTWTPQDDDSTPLAWAPTYPDFARAHRPRPHGGLSFVAIVEAAAVAPELSWQPEYPDRVPSARRNPFGGTTEPPSRVTPGFELWAPTYPDFATGPAPRLEGGLFATQYFDPEPPLDWLTVYPDLARAARRNPFGLLVEPIEPPTTASSTSAPSYAETVDSRSKVTLTETWCRSIAVGESTAVTTDSRSKAQTTNSASRSDNMAFNIKVGDLDPPVRATLKDQDNTAVDITGGTVTFRWRRKGTSTWTSGSASITLASAGTVYYRFTTGQTDTAGTYESEWIVTTSGNPRTYPSEGFELFYINDD